MEGSTIARFAPTKGATAREGRQPRARRPRKKHGTQGPKKRLLSDEQATVLELNFRENQRPDTVRKAELAHRHGLDPKQLATWFQNRRARQKTKAIAEGFSKLQQVHQEYVVENARLSSEVTRLKERLQAAEEELARLRTTAGDGADIAIQELFDSMNREDLWGGGMV